MSAKHSKVEKPGDSGFARLELINWIAAGLIALALSMTYLLDGPSEIQSRLDAAQATIDAQRTADAQARFDRAAHAVCGQNAGYTLLDDSTVQCRTHRGHKTIIAKVTL